MVTRLILFIIILSLSSSLAGATRALAQEAVPQTRSGDELPPNVPSNKEKALNFGLVYVAQWGFFFISQAETIRDQGRIENISYNFTRPHFDRDNLENNVIRHTLAGSSYYLFYRSRGYSERRAFFWSVVSSTAFEFTIETLTEPPSYQDLFVTPLLGTAFGMGLEVLGLKLSEDNNVVLTPVAQPRLVGARVQWEF